MDALGDITYKEDQLARVLKFLNRQVFGNLFWNNKKLRARIAGVQKVLAHHRSNRLEELEVELISEYNKILEQASYGSKG